jgi:hypothetical protein
MPSIASISIKLVGDAKSFVASLREGGGAVDNFGRKLSPLRELKQTFGRGSDFTQYMKILAGSGALVGLGLAARGIRGIGDAVTETADLMDKGVGAYDAYMVAVGKFPAIGDVGVGIREILGPLLGKNYRESTAFLKTGELPGEKENAWAAKENNDAFRMRRRVDIKLAGGNDTLQELLDQRADFEIAFADKIAHLRDTDAAPESIAEFRKVSGFAKNEMDQMILTAAHGANEGEQVEAGHYALGRANEGDDYAKQQLEVLETIRDELRRDGINPRY